MTCAGLTRAREQELRVDNNRLVELDTAIGERLPNLRVLDLHNNELPSLPPSVGHMHFLHELNLNGARAVCVVCVVCGALRTHDTHAANAGNPLEDEALLSPSVQFIRSYLASTSFSTAR